MDSDEEPQLPRGPARGGTLAPHMRRSARVLGGVSAGSGLLGVGFSLGFWLIVLVVGVVVLRFLLLIVVGHDLFDRALVANKLAYGAILLAGIAFLWRASSVRGVLQLGHNYNRRMTPEEQRVRQQLDAEYAERRRERARRRAPPDSEA